MTQVATFHELMEHNRRNSAILIACFIAFFIALGLLIGTVWGGDWTWGVLVAAGAAVLSFFLTMGSYFGGAEAILSMSKAVPLNRSDDPQLYNVVEEMAIAAGLPAPKIYLINDTAPNAFATGRNPQNAVIAITTGLRQKLNRDQLQGVMAHEMSHIRNNDVLFAMLMAMLVGATVLMSDAFLRSLRYGGLSGGRGRSRSSSSSQGGGPAMLILLLVALVLAIISPILARIIQMAMSRQREFLADASAVQLTRNPEGLASALQLLENDQEVLEVANRATAHLYIVHPVKKFEERSGSIFDSHPPLRDRIARLRGLER